MNNIKHWVVLAGVILGLVGCMASPQQGVVRKNEIDYQVVSPVRRIAILDIPNPPFYWMGEGTGAGSVAFGVWGMMAELANAGKNSHLYGDFDFSDLTKQRLEKNLGGYGYEVKVVEVEREEGKEATLMKSYDDIDAGRVDAILDVVPISVGYKGANSLTLAIPDLAPHVTVAVRLVSASSKEVIYSESFSYGYQKALGATWIKVPDGYQDYDNVDELKEDMPRAIAELETGVYTVADMISSKLGKLKQSE